MEGEQISSSSVKKSLEEQLDDLCIYYMGIGVPYEEFWYGDYCKLKYYEKVFLQKRKLENENAWINGMYEYSAVSTALSNGFRKKGTQAIDYLKEPLDLFPKTEQEIEMEKQLAREKVIQALNSFKAEWDRKHEHS